MFSFSGETSSDLQWEDAFETTCDAPMLCPVGVYLPSNQCFSGVHYSSLTEAEEGKKLSVLMYVSIMSTFPVPARHHELVLSFVSGMCLNPPCSKMPPSSSSSADVLLPASHTLCVWHRCILHPFGACLPFARTNLEFLLPHCRPNWGMVCGGHAPRASSALGQQGGTAEFFQLIYICAYTHWAGLRSPAFISRLPLPN